MLTETICTSRLRCRHCSLHHSVNSGCPAGTKPKPVGALEAYVSCPVVSEDIQGDTATTDDRVQFLLLLRHGLQDNLVWLLLLVGGSRSFERGRTLWRVLWTRMVYSSHNAADEQEFMSPKQMVARVVAVRLGPDKIVYDDDCVVNG